MKIIDTFSQITDCFTNNIFNMENWEKYANAISPNLAVKLRDDIADYNFQDDVFPLLNNVAYHFDELSSTQFFSFAYRWIAGKDTKYFANRFERIDHLLFGIVQRCRLGN